MEKEMYVLNVLDNDDNYVYCSLLFTNEEELMKAKIIIADFDSEWYCDKDDDYRAINNYYDNLISRLSNSDLQYILLNVETIYIR